VATKNLPTSPIASRPTAMTHRRRWLRRKVSRSLRRCSRAVASSVQPRRRAASDSLGLREGRVTAASYSRWLALTSASTATPDAAVRFRLAADGEGVDDDPLGVCRGGDRVGHGVSAEREAADGAGLPAAGADPRQAERPDDRDALAGHGGAAGIDVVGGAFAGGEHEVAAGDRALAQEGAEALLEGGIGYHVVVPTTTISS